MRLEMSRTAASASLIAALTSRLFYGLTLETADAANAGWMAALLGLALSLPPVWLMGRLRPPVRRVLALPLLFGVVLDAACAVECTAYSESCLAFNHVAPAFLMLPLLAAILRCAWLGGDALGGAARIWIRLFAALMLIVILYQLPYYNAGWLMPWFGAGAGGILRAGVRAAGWNVLLAGSAAGICREEMGFKRLLRGLLVSTAVAAGLVALRQMMAPAFTSEAVTRFTRIDTLLTNGRAPLYLQLPMIVAWFGGMLHLMCFESVAACALTRRLLPNVSKAACMALGLAAVFALALFRAPRAVPFLRFTPYLYHVLTATALTLWLVKGGEAPCAAS